MNHHTNADSKTLPLGFRYIFFKGEPTVEIRDLLNRSVVEASVVIKDVPYIKYGLGYIEVLPLSGFGDYDVFCNEVRDYLRNYDPDYKTKLNYGLEKLRDSIDEYLEHAVKLESTEKLEVFFKTTEKKRSFLRHNDYYETDSWTALLIDDQNGMVVGHDHGIYETRKDGRVHSIHSYLQIRLDYQGRRLSIPFVSMTYSKLLEDVEMIELLNESRPRTKGASCYTQAAHNAGAIIFEGRKPLTLHECKTRRTEVRLYITRESDISTVEL